MSMYNTMLNTDDNWISYLFDKYSPAPGDFIS